jgi:NADP-dependent 3-hydroxy acid dehydrogenase YdfG
VTREADWNAAVVGRFGKLDILVNNAGLFLGKDVEPPASPNGSGYARST